MKTLLSRDFNKLWLGQTVSAFGTQVTNLALPLTAILVLEASPSQMGWINAFQLLPMAVFGLLAGVWVDRLRRKPILVISDFTRGALLISIPLAAYYNVLSLAQLCAVGFGVGSFQVVSAVADRAYLPSILPRDQLLAGNSRIWFSYSLSQTTGPGVAGGLISALTAPLAIAIDALSFVVSGFTILSIRHREPEPARARERQALSDMRFGLVQVARHPLLRPLVLCGGTHNVCSTMIVTVYFLYLSRNLEIEPFVLGVILVTGGLGSIVGSMCASRIVTKLGAGSTMVVVQVVTGIARLCIPLASGTFLTIVALLIVSEFLLGGARSIFNITQISLRQSIIPSESLGRVNASIGFLLWAFTPLGALAAGFTAEWIGIRNTLWIGASGVLLSTGWMLQPEVRGYRMRDAD